MRRLTLALLLLLAFPAAAHATPPTPPADGTCSTGTTTSGYPAVSCLNTTWHCKTKQAHTQVTVNITNGQHVDGIHLDAGCTGVIRIYIHTNGADGIKVHAGVHDLQVYGGPVRPGTAALVCSGKIGIVHQDGVQAMGGLRVTFKWFKVWCPSGNNGGIYVHHGAGDTPGQPTDIVCEHCDLMEANAAFHIGPGAVRSGARFSLLHTSRTKASPPNCRRIDKGAVDPVDESNTCLTPK
jgi:hypothetical protein